MANSRLKAEATVKTMPTRETARLREINSGKALLSIGGGLNLGFATRSDEATGKPSGKMDRKYVQIAEIIKSRIAHGDYQDSSLSSLRDLSDELGVNYLTVRQALHSLCDDGILKARNNKRFEIVEKKRPEPAGGEFAAILPMGALNIGMISMLEKAVARAGGRLRKYSYSYYEDETIPAALSGNFDLIFFFIDPSKLPKLIIDKLREMRGKVASMVFDYRDLGIRLLSEADIETSVNALIGELAQRGHKRLDILGVAHDNEIIMRRLKVAESAAESFGMVRTCLRRDVPDFSHEFETAAELAAELYGGGVAPDAIFVPTVPAAMAVVRTLKDLGKTAGEDYSLVSCEDILLAKNCVPSIAVSYTEGLEPCIDELLAMHRKQDFSKLEFHPTAPLIFRGESLKRK